MSKYNRSIFIFGKSKAVGLSLEKELTDAGFKAKSGSSIEDALSILHANPPLVVIYCTSSDDDAPLFYLKKVREADNKIFRILFMETPNLDTAIKTVNSGAAIKIITGFENIPTLIRIIEKTFNTFENDASTVSAEPKTEEELLKWKETLQSSLKARTKSIQLKSNRLEAINKELQGNLFETIHALFSYLEKKNQWIGRHCKVVAALSLGLARELELDSNEIETIEIAALLHDIGKIGIPDKIVSKSQHLLTKEQLELLTKHVQFGNEILEPIISLRTIGEMIYSHHEHFDGKGYPQGLSGDKIPLGSRIIAVCNTFDNVSQQYDRKIKSGSIDPLKAIRSKSGTILDPEIAKTFQTMMERNKARHSIAAREMLVKLENLKPGVMLSRDLFSTRGTMVLRKGQVIMEQQIEYIKEFDRLEKLLGDIFVYDA